MGQILADLKAIDKQQLVDHFNLSPSASYKAATLWEGETVCISKEAGTRILKKHQPILPRENDDSQLKSGTSEEEEAKLEHQLQIFREESR